MSGRTVARLGVTSDQLKIPSKDCRAGEYRAPPAHAGEQTLPLGLRGLRGHSFPPTKVKLKLPVPDAPNARWLTPTGLLNPRTAGREEGTWTCSSRRLASYLTVGDGAA
jgi:hypothetical protein